MLCDTRVCIVFSEGSGGVRGCRLVPVMVAHIASTCCSGCRLTRVPASLHASCQGTAVNAVLCLHWDIILGLVHLKRHHRRPWGSRRRLGRGSPQKLGDIDLMIHRKDAGEGPRPCFGGSYIAMQPRDMVGKVSKQDQERATSVTGFSLFNSVPGNSSDSTP